MTPEEKEKLEAMRLVVERMFAAGWVESSHLSPLDMNVELTELGRERILQMKGLLDEIGWPATKMEARVLLQFCQTARIRPPQN